MGVVPQRFEHEIGKSKREQVLHRFLAEIMIDPENPVFGEARRDRVVNLLARSEVGAERLFQRQTNIVGCQPNRLKSGNDRFEQAWRGRQEDSEARFLVADRLGQPGKALFVIDVERNVIEPGKKAAGDFFIEEAIGQMLLQRLAGEGAEAVAIQVRTGGADDVEIRREQPIRIEAVERGKKHSAGQVAGRAKHQECGRFVSHGADVTSNARNGSEFRSAFLFDKGAG